MAVAQRKPRELPHQFKTYPLVRSYAQEGDDGELYLVEIRQDPYTKIMVQARFPIPITNTPPRKTN